MKRDPRTYRISEHFVLSDFLGNQSVYSKGLVNAFDFDAPGADEKLRNLQTLCTNGLEKVMDHWGPLSVSYGYISPEVSRRLVKYQDPDKPSHHRFDLGAAADICVHDFVQGKFDTVFDLSMPESARSAPIALAHGIDYLDIPYSRLITYSESPYICLALSAAEVETGRPRKAFYENRYQGKPKAKPEYIQLSTQGARNRHLQQLQEQGLEHPWEGEGYPTYHGGGYRQYQHRRVSRYTMVSDWLFDLQSISNGFKNIPKFTDEVEDSFAAAGIVYDWLIERTGVKRLSIVKGFVSSTNPGFRKDNDWRTPSIKFSVVPPETEMDVDEFRIWAQIFGGLPDGIHLSTGEGWLDVEVDVNAILNNAELL